MKTDHEVGFDLLIDEFGTRANFGGAVEEFGVREIFGAKWGDGFFFGAGESDAGAKFFEEWFEILCGAKSHGPLFDGGSSVVF